jgi:hypothetical protein
MGSPVPCRHHHTRVEHYLSGREPETGYREDSTTITCCDCHEVFTEAEYAIELAGIDAEPPETDLPQAGEVYQQFGLRYVILEVDENAVSYVTKAAAYTGPVRSVLLDQFLHERATGRITLAESA